MNLKEAANSLAYKPAKSDKDIHSAANNLRDQAKHHKEFKERNIRVAWGETRG